MIWGSIAIKQKRECVPIISTWKRGLRYSPYLYQVMTNPPTTKEKVSGGSRGYYKYHHNLPPYLPESSSNLTTTTAAGSGCSTYLLTVPRPSVCLLTFVAWLAVCLQTQLCNLYHGTPDKRAITGKRRDDPDNPGDST